MFFFRFRSLQSQQQHLQLLLQRQQQQLQQRRVLLQHPLALLPPQQLRHQQLAQQRQQLAQRRQPAQLRHQQALHLEQQLLPALQQHPQRQLQLLLALQQHQLHALQVLQQPAQLAQHPHQQQRQLLHHVIVALSSLATVGAGSFYSGAGTAAAQIAGLVDPQPSPTYYNSGGYAPQYVQLALPSTYTINIVCLQVAQSPNGVTHHQLLVGPTSNPTTLASDLNGYTYGDINQRFYPIGLCLISTDEDAETFVTLFRGIKLCAAAVNNQPYEMNTVVADSAPSVTTTVKSELPTARRLMCWTHVKRKIREHRKLTKKRQVSSGRARVHEVTISI
ncbi:unnamed protein product [Rotaria sordida]|uniref:MULE transposase domain-containing protein n=1 Tax=Rotaria sordida TaxID=392033 RepID=A0A819KK74_9BILA|nr:unnamed protein product [Rotaria sordida]